MAVREEVAAWKRRKGERVVRAEAGEVSKNKRCGC